jgi:hypothetical protein
MGAAAAAAAERARSELATRLGERRPEIERAALTRVVAVSDPGEIADPEYVEGLRAAVTAALDFGIAGLERGDGSSLELPAVLLTQARLAARTGVTLDTVLRRYFAGYTLLGDFVIGAAEDDGLLESAAIQRLLRAQAALFDRLIAAVTEEYTREDRRRSSSSEERLAAKVRKLLAGDLVDSSDLPYNLDDWHVGVVGEGDGADRAVRHLAASLDRRLLLIRHREGAVWAWLGTRRDRDTRQLGNQMSSSWPAQVVLAIGEPGRGLAGWRLTHRQAVAALPVARRRPDRVVRYADVALLASLLADDLLADSLRELYLAPLEKEPDRGEELRRTLRAYIAAGRNVSSAAAELGIGRKTIAKRLRSVEERVGRPLVSCAVELEAALRLDGLLEGDDLRRSGASEAHIGVASQVSRLVEST